VGSACGPTPLREYVGCAGGWCETANGAQNGACQPYRQAGEPCDPRALEPCGLGQCDRVALTCVYACAEQ
jgi:hypothetical protein